MTASPKATIIIDGKRHAAREGRVGFELDMPCPCCGKTPAIFIGGQVRIKDIDSGWSDTYEADGGCFYTQAFIQGVRIELKVSTLFGLAEDVAIYSLGIRVY